MFFKPNNWLFSLPSEATMCFTRAFQIFFLITANLTISLGTSLADDTTEQMRGITIDEAVVTPGNRIENTQLRFKIINFSTQDVRLEGVRTDLAEAVEIKIDLPGKGFQTTSNLAILREETLDLGSSHIMVGLINLKQDIKPGTKIAFELVFRGFTMSAVAHAH